MDSVTQATNSYKFSLLGPQFTRQDGTGSGQRVCKRLITVDEWAHMQDHPDDETAKILAVSSSLRRLERPDLSELIIDRALRTPEGLNLRALLEGRETPEDLLSLRRLVKRLLPACAPALALPEGGGLARPDPYFLAGLMPVDVDHFDGPVADADRESVWRQIVECPHIPAAGGSASGADFWALVAIPKANTLREYKKLYWAALHHLPFLRMRQDKGQDNPNRERYQGAGRIHVRDTVTVLDRDMLLAAHAGRASAGEPCPRRVTVNGHPPGGGGHQQQSPGDWWEQALHDMRTRAHGSRHLGIFRCGLTVWSNGGDYDVHLEEMVDAAADAGVTDASEVERQFANGYRAGQEGTQERPSGRATGAGTGAPGGGTSPGEEPKVRRSDTGLQNALDAMGVAVRRNVRSRNVELWLPEDQDWSEGLLGRGLWSPMEDDIESRLICEIQRRFNVVFGTQTWTRSLNSLLASRQVDAMWEHVYGGKWDGKHRLENGLQQILGVENSPLTRWALQSVLLSAIDRMHVPGAPHHTTVVLVSVEAGFGKSAFWRLICPQGLFIDVRDLSIPFKELNERISKSVIVEFSELAGLNDRNQKVIKALLTSEDDSMRWSYGRSVPLTLRQWVGVGSCNVDAAGALPEDASGHRRWLVVEVPHLVEYKTIEQWANENASQLWYEALEMYRSTPEEDRTSLHHVPTSLRRAQFENNSRYEERHEGIRAAALELTRVIRQPKKLVDLMLESGIHVPRAAPEGVPWEERMAEARAAATRDKAAQNVMAKELQRLGWVKRDTSMNGEKGVFWFPPARDPGTPEANQPTQ
jgi:hypothetical protein